jgi:hypothetical protein
MADTPEATVQSGRCYLLDVVPREIRNMIWANVTSSCRISKEKPTANANNIRIEGSPMLSLLLVNHQIHEEYLDVTLTTADLNIDLDNTHDGLFDLAQSFPTPLLKKFRWIFINTFWMAPIKGFDKLEKIVVWIKNHTAEELRNQQSMACSPTKGTSSAEYDAKPTN